MRIGLRGAPALGDYARPAVLSERELLRGYGYRRGRVEPCACGGAIEVEDRHDQAEVFEQVALHRATQRHRAWAAGWERR